MIKLTGDDLRKVQVDTLQEGSEEQLTQFLNEIETAFDRDIQVWAKKFCMTAML